MLNDFSALGEKIAYLQEVQDLLELSPEEELLKEFDKEITKTTELANSLYMQVILNGEFDNNNAIVKIHSGAGGTEACDWAEMLFRMYKMFATKNGYKINVFDELAGDGAGIKSVTFEIVGDSAYGYLKGETGVHRLVRISPFDANKKRHTSFASVEVMPEIENDTTVQIADSEIRVDTYRASGAGGQHVNTTDSAIRITHLPTGVVVTCQNERSQIKNRETAMKLLRSKLADLKLQENQRKQNELAGTKQKIEWGSQIRSYVFCPYTKVTDHRTNHHTSNVDATMDGHIWEFIYEYLKWNKS